MREVEVPLTRESLAEALGELRKWLDHHACVPVDFDIARREGARLIIRVVFEDEVMAEAFQWTLTAQRTANLSLPERCNSAVKDRRACRRLALKLECQVTDDRSERTLARGRSRRISTTYSIQVLPRSGLTRRVR